MSPIKTQHQQPARAVDQVRSVALRSDEERIQDIADELVDTLYGSDIQSEALTLLFPYELHSAGLRLHPQWEALKTAIVANDSETFGRISLNAMAEARLQEAKDLVEQATECLKQDAADDAPVGVAPEFPQSVGVFS